ncbi:Hect E3 ubiquitin ligase [Caligus rogercresseyi]|uniref:Hect E3 ubiquitin ligase n=1 Tax=Caligus rogercresseyi TaxID=217165 RepID=A0A7T8HJ48_CALRO|nr:Hect E3 ubiquitin ligase [Caligus rogercresseyi]
MRLIDLVIVLLFEAGTPSPNPAPSPMPPSALGVVECPHPFDAWTVPARKPISSLSSAFESKTRMPSLRP